MKKLIPLLFSLIFWTCLTEPEFDNPLDPDNPDFEPPETIIIGGPAEGEIVSESIVTFHWKGNEHASEYATNLNNIGWSAWSLNTEINYEYLDEDDYTFQVKSRYSTGDEDDSPAEIHFTIDAIQGQSLRVFPLLTETSVNQSKTVSVYMEEVNAVMATEFAITYNPLLVTLQHVSEGELLSGFNGESVLIYELIEGESVNAIKINLGVAIGVTPGLTGTGSIVDVEFLPFSAGDFDIELTGLIFRDNNNVEITVNQIVNGRFEVE